MTRWERVHAIRIRTIGKKNDNRDRERERDQRGHVNRTREKDYNLLRSW